MIWPEGKKFAFTIFDDTDFATLANVKPVYDFLESLGFRTTKSVWPIQGLQTPICEGDTCENPDYLEWLKSLKSKGFEIGYHMATFHSSLREETRIALDRFADLFGNLPKTMANHSACRENIYWGSDRLTGINKTIYNMMTRYRFNNRFRGHIENDPLFWGDICKERITYIRNFVYPEINTLKVCPFMPYHDPKRPFVNYWYASSEGPKVDSFVKTISEENQDQLEAEGGACIMYTHLAVGFYELGQLHPQFKMLMERLSRKNGWFVPVGTLLDYLREKNGHHVITNAERSRMERKWLWHKMRVGRT